MVIQGLALKGDSKSAAPSPGKRSKQADNFPSVFCSFSPSQPAQGLSISFILACLEPITDAEISAFDGYQSETRNGLGASRPRQEEMSESGEPNSAILEII